MNELFGRHTVRIVFLSITKIPTTVKPIGSPVSRLRNTFTYNEPHTIEYNDRHAAIYAGSVTKTKNKSQA